MTDPSDIRLMERIAARDSLALRTFYDRYAHVAFALAYRIIGEAGAAEQIVEATFEAIWYMGRDVDLDNGGDVRVWLLMILRHRAIELRHMKIGRQNGHLPADCADQALTSGDAWQEVPAPLLVEQVRVAMRRLPEEQRRAIELAWFEGLSHGAIASREGISPGTAQSRLREGLSRLDGLLAGALFEPAEEKVS